MASIKREGPAKGNSSTLRCLEFYSGIGGLHYALKGAIKSMNLEEPNLDAVVVQAFDINNIANKVYEANFGVTVSPKTILSITPAALDKLDATDLWLLSPPCQPYTRQGNQKDTEDPRAASFLHLISIIPKLNKRPKRILIENVVGFEKSQTRRLLVSMLRANNYNFQEFHISPHMIGIPNSRMRYFCLASCITTPPTPIDSSRSSTELRSFIPGSPYWDSTTHMPRFDPSPLSEFLEDHSKDEDGGTAFFEQNRVPDEVLLKSGMSFDLVFESSPRSCCFTKNYGRLVEGTGSVIQTAPQQIEGIPDQPNSLLALKLRYLSPREIANLHGFPSSCRLESVTKKQSYSLLGNSLNVTIVTELILSILNWSPLEPL